MRNIDIKLFVIAFFFGCVFCYFIGKAPIEPRKTYTYRGEVQSKLLFTKDEQGHLLSDSTIYNIKGGIIPNPETAAKIGIAILEDIYGKDMITDEKPFVVEKDFHSWNIYGTSGQYPKEYLGGNSEICLDRATGKVLNYSHKK